MSTMRQTGTSPALRGLLDMGRWAFRWRGLLVPLFVLLPAVVLRSTMHDQLPGVGRFTWALGAGLGCLGLCLRSLTVGFVRRGSSGRNTRGQKASVLNVTGAYAVVRNPLYVANMLMVGGVVTVLGSWWILGVSLAAVGTMYALIVRLEESFLWVRFGTTYERYAHGTPRFLPHPWRWMRPHAPWSWRMVIRREHDPAFALLLAFGAARTYRIAILGERTVWDPRWAVTLTLGAAIWLGTKVVKKRTRLLQWGQAGPREENR